MASLSKTEDKGTAGVTCNQDMLYIMQVIELLGLDIKKLMVFEMDNKGLLDLANNGVLKGIQDTLMCKATFYKN